MESNYNKFSKIVFEKEFLKFNSNKRRNKTPELKIRRKRLNLLLLKLKIKD